jgi:protein-tyrosine-phosphatase
MADVPEVLFVCTHNAGRSQMAAALLNQHAAGWIRVTSAGSQPASELNPAAGARARKSADGYQKVTIRSNYDVNLQR